MAEDPSSSPRRLAKPLATYSRPGPHQTLPHFTLLLSLYLDYKDCHGRDWGGQTFECSRRGPSQEVQPAPWIQQCTAGQTGTVGAAGAAGTVNTACTGVSTADTIGAGTAGTEGATGAGAQPMLLVRRHAGRQGHALVQLARIWAGVRRWPRRQQPRWTFATRIARWSKALQLRRYGER